MIISAINQQYNFPTVKFKGIRDKASYSHPFLSFEPLMSVPIETSRVYFSPVFTHGYREIANYNTPYTKACKMYELANGHKVIVFQKNGPMVMQTGVKTDDKVSEDYKHLIEHIIYNSNNKIGTQTFGDLQKDLALNRDAGCNSDVSLFTLKYSFDNPKDIEKVINAQSKLLFNADIERYFEKEKNIIKTELWENGHSEDMIKNLSINEAKDYYHKTYKNQNMVTAVSSPLPPDEIIRMFSKHFQNSDNTGFVSSNINRINVNEKDAFENFLKNVSRKKGNATLQAKAQSALTALTWTPGLINFSVEDIFKNGKPYILNYHTKLNQINNTLKQPSFKMNSSYVDTAGIKEFIYPNNLTLTLDSGACSNAASKYHYLLKTDGFPAKPGTNEILGCILSSALEQNAERQDYSLEATVYTGNNYIKIDSVCLPQHTLKDIKDIKNTLLHVNLSQENFENAKALTKKRFLSAVSSVDSKKDVLLNKDEYLYTGNVPLYIPVQEAMALYDKITLDDVKQLYNHLLTTSSASAVFSVSPELTAGKNKELLLSSIGSQLPVFRPHKEVVQTDKSDRTVSMPARAHVIKRLSKENYAAVSLNYKIPLTKDLRENLGIKILETIIGGESYSRLFTQLRDRDSLVYNANSLLEEQYLTYSNLVLVTKVLVNEGNFDNLKKVCNCFKENIQNLRTLPVKEAELNTAKLTVKSYIANAMEIPATRHYYLSKFGLQGIQKAYNLIDNLTAADIRALADKYLKNGVWCIDAPKEAYEYNNEYLNCLENEII